METSGGPNAQNPLESAARYVGGGGAPAASHEESFSVRSSRAKAEESRLIQWATANGKFSSKLPNPEDRGGEHAVSYDPKGNRYLKVTRPDAHLGYGLAMTSSGLGATPAEYLDRLALNNLYFGDDVRLENVAQLSGKPVIVTSQPFIDGPPATPSQIVRQLDGTGLEHIAPGTFYSVNKGVLAFDLYPRNVKYSQGLAIPIDPVMQRVTLEFARFIRSNYQRLPDYQNTEAQEWARALRQSPGQDTPGAR